jgi:hypothetical protein
MILGWHVDSNLCRRLYLRNGGTRSLVDQLFGYHCDHMRVATLAHRANRIENDLQAFFFRVDSPNVAEQSDSWGLPNVDIPEVDLARGPASRFAGSMAEILEPLDTPFREISAMAAWEELTYRSEHLVPYLGDQLVTLPETVAMTYVGCNGRMASLLSDLVRRLGFRLPLRAFRLEKALDDGAAGWPSDLPLVDFDKMMAESRLLIFDFGFDASTYPSYVGRRLGDWPAAPRQALGSVLDAMENAVVQDLDSGPSGNSQYRKYVTLNTISNVFEPLIADLLIAVPTPFGGRVRHGLIDRSYESPFKRVKKALVAYLSSQLACRMDRARRYELGEMIDFSEKGDSYRFAEDGWSWGEAAGTWTDGPRATIRLFLTELPRGDLIARWRIDRVAAWNPTLTVEVIGAGRVLDVWRFPTGLSAHDRTTVVPSDVVDQNRQLLLELRIHNPISPGDVKDGLPTADPRKLGVHLAALRLERASFVGKVAEQLGFRRR